MATDRVQQKYSDIRQEYIKWINKRKDGHRIYTDNYIINILAKKFYLANKTIENIVFHRV